MLTLRFFIAALAAFLPFPRIHDNPVLTPASSVRPSCCWSGGRSCGAAHSTRTRLKIAISLRPQHYLQAIAHASIFVYWGMYWPPIQDAAALIVAQIVFAYAFDSLLSWTRKTRIRPRLRPVPDHLQHEPVPALSRRLVLPAVPDGGGWFPRQGADSLAPRRQARAHLQPVVVPARAVLAGPDCHADDAHHLGRGDRDAADPAAAHLPVHLCRRAARPVPVWRHQR